MAVTQVIYLTQAFYGIHPSVHMVQGDTGRNLKMVIKDVAMSGSPIGEVFFTRSDDTHYSTNAEFSAGDNSFIADMTQALTQPGRTKCNLTVTDANEKTVSTYVFDILVDEHQDGTSEAQLGYSIEEITEIIDSARGGGMSEDVKQALLNCFYHVAWVDSHGQDYVDNLEEALYPPAVLVSITAYYNQTGTIYDTDDLDDLKPDLTVMANYDNGQSVPVSTYTLSGSLVAGTSTIRVNYDTKYTTFDVNVTHMPGIISVVNNLVNATNSNSATTVSEGDSYTATISPASGYTLTGASVIITMGSTDITSSVYSNGTISIDEVTDTLTISVSAVAVTLVSISAVYTQSGTVYNTDSLDSLKDDLVVTATWSDSSTSTVPSTDYTLSGTLTVGTSTVTVSYGGKTATFNVTVTEDNRYVTANLVHHWDAIDNTGNGHSNSSQTWVDLVGSDFFTIVGSSITWGDNCLIFGGTSGDHLIGDEVAGACAEKTVEVVFAPDDDRDAGVACVFNNIGGTDSTGDYAVGKISMFRGNCVSGKGTPGSKIYPTGLSAMTDVRSVVCSYVDNSTISSLYVNGVKQTESNTTSSFKGTSGKRSAGASPTTYSYPFKGKMYAIRIYDAILSDADVAHNYAIDASRFNL